jgi:hypothetical protein
VAQVTRVVVGGFVLRGDVGWESIRFLVTTHGCRGPCCPRFWRASAMESGAEREQ